MNQKNGIGHCLMRCGGRIIHLANIWSVYDERIRQPVGICDRCGHVQISRLFEAAEYTALNNRFFVAQYDPATADTRASTREKKIQTTLSRLAPVIGKSRGGGNLLDVGAGEGWSHHIAQHFGLDYYVVEAQLDLAKHLESRGATIAAGTIQGLLPDWSQQFKAILLRHTLEHLLDPIGDLETLAQCLAPDGFLYVALPNFTKARPKAGFRTDYLRPVHISYFTPNKLEWSLHLAGLRAGSIHDEGELWAIARLENSKVELKDERDENRTRFNYLVRTNRSRDIRNIGRILGHRLLGRLPGPAQQIVRWGRKALSIP